MGLQILLVHQSYPAQFVHLEAALRKRGHRLTTLSRQRRDRKGRNRTADRPAAEGGVVRHLHYPVRRGNAPDLTPLLQDLETKVLRGEWAARICESLHREGYVPDLILAHAGWGECLFMADIWPQTPQLHYLEFDYGTAVDVDFDPEFRSATSWWERARLRMKTANTLLNLQTMAWGYTPTRFQWQTLPAQYRGRVSVIHDGIDTDQLKPDASATYPLANGVQLRRGDRLLTFVNRTFEPYRGVHRLLRALPELQQRWPDLQVLLIGKDTPRVSYGKARTDGRGWLAQLREDLGSQLDWRRIHTPGQISHEQFIRAMQVSAVHVYFTYPFVLSWSLLEAMACGALVVGSATAPVEEVIQDGHNGLLVGFHDQTALIATVSEALAHPQRFVEMRRAARKRIKEHYRLQDCLRRQLALIDCVASGTIGASLAQ